MTNSIVSNERIQVSSAEVELQESTEVQNSSSESRDSTQAITNTTLAEVQQLANELQVTENATYTERDHMIESDPETKRTQQSVPKTADTDATTRARPTLPVVNCTSDSDDDDVASKAALALAAVAAAATANNKSPAEAAREARAVAQSIISTNNGMEKTPDTYYSGELRVVDLSLVKRELLQLADGAPLTHRLARGHNDAFLQHLLLMEFFTCIEVDHKQGEVQNAEEIADPELVKEACSKVEGLIRRAESAYDSLVDMLPKDSRRLMWDNGLVETPESPVVVPDLLPPCITRDGDATEAFFRVCSGESFEFDEDSRGSSVTNATSINAGSDFQGGHEDTTMDARSSSPSRQGSVFNYMFRRSSGGSKGLGQVFRKKPTRRQTSTSGLSHQVFEDEAPVSQKMKSGEYIVRIEREMLGLTVENVLERTLVRTVLPGGPAKKAGAKVGSLIVKVGNVETRNLTHFETIDELRQSQRPLQLVLRHVDDDSIRSAREEMGRLIQGAGFGILQEGIISLSMNDQHLTQRETIRPLIANDLRIDAFTKRLHKRLTTATPVPKNKKEELLSRLEESLIWILSLFIVGLEREALRIASGLENTTSETTIDAHHLPKDYGDASRSVSKVLLDYARKKLEKKDCWSLAQHGSTLGTPATTQTPPAPQHRGKSGRRSVVAPSVASHANSSMSHDKPLLLIGDVLQRVRTFLADTTSPPAALLRGELIAFLSNVLDIDTEMELAEEESASAGVDKIKSGSISDLGSAGTLLKLIVLNCAAMRSPECHEISAMRRDGGGDRYLDFELRRRFGAREDFSTSDLHRLHAGNRFLAVVHRLAASRSVSARITACSLAPVLWGHLDFPHTLQLRGVITRALHDVEVIVRKATATVLHEIAELVFDPRSVPWLVLMCERAMTDPEPQLRCAAMTLTWHLAENLPNAFLGDASQGSRYLRRLPSRSDPIFADVYLLQCKLLPVATRLAEDRSPSVRLAVAAQCDRLCDALGDHWSSVVIDVLLALLSDVDESVRCEAVCCVPRLAEIVLLSSSPGEVAVSEVSVLEALIPSAIKLQKDKVSSVRIALAGAAGELLTLFVGLQSRVAEMVSSPLFQNDDQSEKQHEVDSGRAYKRQVDDRLIPLVQILLNDSDPEVTSAALRAVTNATRSSVHQSRARHLSTASEDDSISVSSYHSHASRERPVFFPVLSESQVMRLLPTLTELSGSRQWRVRQSAVEIVPALLGCTQKLDTRLMISKLCIGLLSDKVDAVRRTAAECLCLGGGSLGSHGEDIASEWTTSVVIPTIRRCAMHSASKQRLLSLKMMEIVFQNGSYPSRWGDGIGTEGRNTASPSQEMIAVALSLTNDSIANIRLNVGRVLEPALHMFDFNEISFIAESMRDQIQREEAKDKAGDRDVLFFARKCLTRAESILIDRELSSARN